MFKIQKGIQKVKGGKTQTKKEDWGYPLDKMLVGDSFAIPGEVYDRKNVAKIRGRILLILANHPQKEVRKMRFSVGKDPKTAENPEVEAIIRVWRTL